MQTRDEKNNTCSNLPHKIQRIPGGRERGKVLKSLWWFCILFCRVHECIKCETFDWQSLYHVCQCFLVSWVQNDGSMVLSSLVFSANHKQTLLKSAQAYVQWFQDFFLAKDISNLKQSLFLHTEKFLFHFCFHQCTEMFYETTKILIVQNIFL